MKITVVLMDSEGVTQHASGKVDPELISEHNGIMRRDLFYSFWKMQDSVVYFKNVTRDPYIITEW